MEVKPKPHASGRELAPSFEWRNVKEFVGILPSTLGLDFSFSCILLGINEGFRKLSVIISSILFYSIFSSWTLMRHIQDYFISLNLIHNFDVLVCVELLVISSYLFSSSWILSSTKSSIGSNLLFTQSWLSCSKIVFHFYKYYIFINVCQFFPISVFFHC